MGEEGRLTEQRAAQGLPPTIEDPVALAKIAAIVLGVADPPGPVSEDMLELSRLQEEIRAERNDLKRLRRTTTERLEGHVALARQVYDLECEVERLRAELDAAKETD